MRPSFEGRALIALGIAGLIGFRANAWADQGGEGADFQTRKIRLEGRYLNLPVAENAPRRTMTISVDHRVVRRFEISLAESTVDFWGFTDVSAWRGKMATIRLDPAPVLGDSPLPPESGRPLAPEALRRLSVGDELQDSAQIYREALRPQFHFTTRRGYTNDPNGLVFFRGEYHLFFQLLTSSVRYYGDKAWGHAVSRDLVHWHELPIALYPDQDGAKWSGSAVVDWHNSGGFQRGSDPALVLFYTTTGRSALHPVPKASALFRQFAAFSNDRGRSWTAYSGNPILKNITRDNRDPLVFWHEPTRRWILVLYVGYPKPDGGKRNTAQIFDSENLKDWTYQSSIEGFFDCPNLFELPLDGKASEPRWIVHCAPMAYKVGRFDGRRFVAETELLPGQRGDCAYAPQTFNDAPDGRRIQMAWGRTSAPGMPFSQIMLFPCELSLVTTFAGPRLRWWPVREIEKLYSKRESWRNQRLSPSAPAWRAQGREFDLQAEIDPGSAAGLELDVRGVRITYRVRDKLLTAGGASAPLALSHGKLRLRVLVDRTSVEIFGDDGMLYMPLAALPSLDNDTIACSVSGGTATLDLVDLNAITSIWPVRLL